MYKGSLITLCALALKPEVFDRKQPDLNQWLGHAAAAAQMQATVGQPPLSPRAKLFVHTSRGRVSLVLFAELEASYILLLLVHELIGLGV